ncbi:conserved hypothetical protein [Klebsiella quasipneumoniae subsp. similipneumoniae]|jgi:hypothetical protein|nr:conserved hypothetical protein [Klebsiella quasipneumoniae subsp. similipneumoniae]
MLSRKPLAMRKPQTRKLTLRSNRVQAAVSSEAAAFLLRADIIKTGKILRRCITLDSLIMMMSLP